MVFEGYIAKDKKSKYWAIGVDALDIHTQGTSEKNAFTMLQGAITDLARADHESLGDHATISIYKGEDKDKFNVKFDELSHMLGFILTRLRCKSNMSLAELSAKLGKNSRTVVQRYMSGKSVPWINSFDEIIGAMGYKIKIG
jgi:ribosome-binding protein aMBF1 (putative translation factor)